MLLLNKYLKKIPLANAARLVTESSETQSNVK